MSPTKPMPGLDDLQGYDTWVEVVKTYSKCQRLMTQRLAEIELSVAQHEVLLALGRDPGLSQQALAERLLVGKSNVTGLLTRLETRGLAERRDNPADARGRLVFLTTEGTRLLKRSIAVQSEVVQLMLEGLRPKQVSELDRVMRIVGQRLNEALQQPS